MLWPRILLDFLRTALEFFRIFLGFSLAAQGAFRIILRLPFGRFIVLCAANGDEMRAIFALAPQRRQTEKPLFAPANLARI